MKTRNRINTIAFVLFFFVALIINVSGHNLRDGHLPHRKFELKNHHHLHASFLMMRRDSVFLETENGSVRTIPLSDFSKEDQRFLLGRMAEIAQLNQPRAKATWHQTNAFQDRSGSDGGNWSLFFLYLSILAAVTIYLIRQYAQLPGILKLLSVASVTLFTAFTLFSFRKQLLGPDPLFIDAAFKPFKPEVATRWDANWFYVESKGIPTTHSMMTGITSWQQQVPIPQCYIGNNAWQIPLNPVLATEPVPVNPQHFLRGAVAIAANGVPIFNPYTNTGVDALLDGQLDQWGGHSGRADDYHYHVAPLFLDSQTVEILPIAFALDGFAIYAGREPDGAPMLPLDANHGHFDASGIYHYHGTPEAPYMIGKMVGRVTEDATMQIIPQPRATPVRPSLTPLNGATITDFQPNGKGNGYILTYTRNGQNTKVDYSWTKSGTYTFNFISSSGTIQEVYNGFLPCEVTTQVGDLGDDLYSVQVFPNPGRGKISIAIKGMDLESVHGIFVFDLNGRLVFQKNQPVLSLETDEWPQGSYFVKVIHDRGELNQKIIIP